MKANKLLFFIVIFLLSMSISTYLIIKINKNNQKKSDEILDQDYKNSEITSHKVNEIYYCPMHPNIKSHKPDSTCPICSMDLVKSSSVDIDESKPQLNDSSNHLTSIDVDNKNKVTDETSTDETNNNNNYDVNDIFQILGLEKSTIIKQINHKNSFLTYAKVAFDSELYQAQSEYLAIKNAKLSYQSDLNLINSAKMRLKILGLSNRQIKILEKNNTPDISLLTSETNSGLIIYAYVKESDINLVYPNQHVDIINDQLDKTFKGFVSSIDNRLDPVSKSVVVRINLKAKKSPLKSGADLRVKFYQKPTTQIIIPYKALVYKDNGIYGYVDNTSKGDFELTKLDVLYISTQDSLVAINNKKLLGKKILTDSQFIFEADSEISKAITFD